MLDDLIPRYEVVLGPTASQTYYARINRACYRARDERASRAVRRSCIDLVEQIATVRPADDDALLHARINLAYWTARSGEIQVAKGMYAALVEDLTVMRGKDHKSTQHVTRLLDRVGNIRRPGSAERDRQLLLKDDATDAG